MSVLIMRKALQLGNSSCSTTDTSKEIKLLHETGRAVAQW